MMSVEEVTSEEQWNTLRPSWNGLLENTAETSVFLTHEWFGCCLDSHGATRNLQVLLVKEKEHLVGIAPLWRYQDRVRGISVRRLGFITSPDTPFVDFIISTGKRDEVLRAVIHHLWTRRKKKWDILTLSQWPAESENCRTFREIAGQDSVAYVTRTASLTPYIPLEGSWDTFLWTRSRRFRKTHRNIINRIARLQKIQVECVHQDSTEALFDQIAALSGKSWKQAAGIAIPSANQTIRFFRSLTRVASARKWLMVWLLKVDGVPIAMEYDLASEGRVCALRADYDDSYSEYSPGAYLEYEIVRRLFQNGYTEYSTGPGLNTYKLNWTDRLRENLAVHIYAPTLTGQLVRAGDKARSLLTGIRDLTR